jgi:hypothetical protein
MIEKIEVRFEYTDDVCTAERLYVVAPWPAQTTFTGCLLNDADRRYVCRSNDVVTLRCDNGTADYRLTNYDYARDVYEASLMDGVWESPPP